MANVKITALEHQSSNLLGAGDVFILDDVTRLVTKKLTVANLVSYTTTAIGNAHVVGSNVNIVQSNLSSAVSTLTTSTNTVQGNVSALTTSTNTIKANVDSVQSNVATAVTSINTVQSNVTTAVTNINTVQSNVSTLTTSVNTIKANVDSVQSNLTALAANVAAGGSGGGGNVTVAFTTIAVPGQSSIVAASPTSTLNIIPGSSLNITSNASNSTLTIAIDQTNINTVQSNVTSLTTSTNTIKANVDSVQSNVNIHTTSINTVQSNVTTAVTSINTVQGNVTSLTTSVNTIKANVDSVQSNVTTAVTSINTVQGNVTSLTTSVNTIKANVDLVQSNVSTAVTSINTVQGNVTSLTTSVNTIKANVDSVQSNVSTAVTSVNTVQSNVSSLSTSVSTISANLNSLAANVAAGGGGGGGNVTVAFTTIAVPGQSSIVAASATSTLNILPGSSLNITSNASNSTLTIAVDQTNINTVQSNVSTLTTSVNTIKANVDSVQSNVTSLASIALTGTVAPTNGGTGQNTLPKASAALTGFLSITSSGGTTTLDATSPETILVTGTLAHTIVLPDVTTLALGWTFNIISSTTGAIAIQSSGLNAFSSIQALTSAKATCTAITGTGTASWVVTYAGSTTRSGGGATVYGISPAITGSTFGYGTLVAGTDAQGQGAIGAGIDIVVVTTTATNPSGVTLTAISTPGRHIAIYNRGTNPINIYPGTGANIDLLAANAPTSLAVGSSMLFYNSSTTQWNSSIYNATSATALTGTVAPTNGGTGQTTLPKAMAALKGFTTIASTGGTTTLDATSPENIMVFNAGATGQTIVLPDVTTLALGWTFTIMNNTGAAVIVQSSGLNAIGTGNQQPGQTARYICIAITGTGTASWFVTYDGATTRTGGGAAVFSGSPLLSGASFAAVNVTAGTDAQGQGAFGTGNDTFFITTTAANPSGVTLFTPNTAGKRIYVFNKGTNPVNVYPVLGSSIDALAANAPLSLPVGGSTCFNNDSLTHWYSSLYDVRNTTSLSGTIALVNGGTGATSAPAAAAQLKGYTTTATAAGTTTLINASSQYQVFTGSTTQTIVLPVTSTLTTGWRFEIVNNSTSNLTVNSSGGNILDTVYPNATLKVTCIGTTLTTAADWEYGHGDFGTVTGSSSLVLSTSASLTTPSLSSPSLSGTPVVTNATSGSAAIASDWVYRLTAPATPFGPTIADVFTTPSSLSLEAASVYEIEGQFYFTKTTAGTALWTNTFSVAPTLFTMESIQTPITGFAAATGATYTPLLLYFYAQGAVSSASAATGSLSPALNHSFKFRATINTSSATNWRLRLTQSAGTATPLAGSYYRIKKIAASTGTFAA